MAVITISRGSFSGGKMLAECAGARLGYRCIDRDVIVEKAAAFGVSQEEIRDALEKPPTFWDRFRHTKYVYLSLVQAALTAEVTDGNAIYHGNAGHLLLRGVSHVMRTRIIAPLPLRAAMVQDRLKMTESNALAYIQKMDRDRQRWTQYLYGVDGGDPALYDLVLNLEHLDIPQACEIIAAMARQDAFKETAASRGAMADLALASRVRANLAVAPQTAHLEVDVVSHAGAVVVKGKLASREQTKDVEEVVRHVSGVVDVDLELFTEIRV